MTSSKNLRQNLAVFVIVSTILIVVLAAASYFLIGVMFG